VQSNTGSRAWLDLSAEERVRVGGKILLRVKKGALRAEARILGGH
jgi:hypothetical protein